VFFLDRLKSNENIDLIIRHNFAIAFPPASFGRLVNFSSGVALALMCEPLEV